MRDCSITNEKMEEIYKKIGQNVKKIRTSKNISQVINIYKALSKQKVDKKTDKEIFVSVSPFRKIKHPLFNRNFNCRCQLLPTSH